MTRPSKAWRFKAVLRLPAGGLYPPYGHIGHWEVTGKVAEELGFSAPARDVLCDAAQDPDFYDFGTVVAHAQTPDEADLCGADTAKRAAIIAAAVARYVEWVDELFHACDAAIEKEVRLALYWLGYALHGVEDLAVHQGLTNGEHAARADNPDYGAADVALSYVYARRAFDAVRNAVGQDRFDRLRNHQGDGRLGWWEKRRKDIRPHGWDIDEHAAEYRAAGKRYRTIVPPPVPVRWDREVVLAQILEGLAGRRRAQGRRLREKLGEVSANPHRRFVPLTPLTPRPPAKWSVLVYMAGDDRSPDGIEYAIAQDLDELKRVGSTDDVHLLVQTDDASGAASYRYRLRKGGSVAADRLERFDGDLNTGSTKTLVDFVQWAHHLFPAERTALVLWGHGSGHDDQDVYRAIRGSVSRRTAARMAQRRLGFFSGTRRAILEQGPTRGYAYDDTAGDFLDNAELLKALQQVQDILGRKVDLLGFDACLMAMLEVAYQVHDVAGVLVASERSEPGDGWWYSDAFRGLVRAPETSAERLAAELVASYGRAYDEAMTLSAVDLRKIPALAQRLDAWATAATPVRYHTLRRRALECGARPGEGYCDLGSFLEAAARGGEPGAREARAAQRALGETVLAACGGATGLTIYAPGNFRPRQAGSTDALYLSLRFARETRWAAFLKTIDADAGAPSTPPGRRDGLPVPTPASALDRFNGRHVLAALRSRAAAGWVDRLRAEVLRPCEDAVAAVAEQLDALEQRGWSPEAPRRGGTPAERRRILVLPGIMGSLLHDRSGKLGGVWIDPWNLLFGEDFEGLRLKSTADVRGRRGVVTEPLPLPGRIPDADDAVRIEAYGVVPILYDRMALALMREFGPVVEYAPYDWRQPIAVLGDGLAARLDALVAEHRGIQIALVAHSMGGLVAAEALGKLAGRSPAALGAIAGVVVLGTPFLGSASAVRALRAEGAELSLLKLLGGKSTAEVEDTVQSLAGLFDLLPCDQEGLIRPSLFTPGPLSRCSPDDSRFTRPCLLARDLPLAEKTGAIVCTSRDTVGAVKVRDDGTVDYSALVPGDGTVPAMSALNGGGLRGQSHEVCERHLTLPLDGEAIRQTVRWLGAQLGVSRTMEAHAWPPAPPIDPPASRDDVVRRLQADEVLTLGDFAALLSLV